MNNINMNTELTSFDFHSLVSYCMDKGIPRIEAIKISRESIKAARHNTSILGEYVNGGIQIFVSMQRKMEEHKELKKRIYREIGKKRKQTMFADLVIEYKQ